MSRVFKRPMFRKGGNVGEGIMTGIRDNYEVGGSAKERLAKIAEQYPQQGFDPLTQFLIQGGLNLVSQPSTGGVLSDIATAAKDPTQQLFKGMAEKGKLARELAIAGEQLDIEREGKEKLLEKEIAGRKEIVAMEKGQGIFSTKDFFDEYGSKVQAENRANYENLDLETKANEAFGQSYEGFIGGKHGRLKDYEKKNNIGKVYYDVTDGSFKRLRRTKDGYEYEPINLGTFDPEADKAAKVKKEDTEKTFPMFSGTKPKKTLKEAFDIGDVPPFDPYGGA
jgi:hypothetical protein